MRAFPRVAVGDAWVDPNDVAGFTRGVGQNALTLTVHTFPSTRGVFRRNGRSGNRRVDRTVSFDTLVDLIATRDRLRGECLPGNSLWLDPQNDRKRVMVVVNPHAGNGRGVKVFEKDVAPVLRCAFADYPTRNDEETVNDVSSTPSPSRNESRFDVLITQKRGDAFEHCVRLDLDLYAGVVCVGGDGTVAEVRNGILAQCGDDCELNKKGNLLPVGVVPTGSGNALAKSFSYATHTPCDATSAALAVARGGWCFLDAADFDEVNEESLDEETQNTHQKTKPAMHSLLSLSWGLFADIDIESERCRWLGGARFTAQAVVRILFPRKYKGCVLRFKPLVMRDEESIDADDVEINNNGSSVRAAAARALVKGHALSEIDNTNPEWRTLRLEKGNHIKGVFALNVPWATLAAHAAPGAAFHDGAFDVVVVKTASRLQMLRLLLSFELGGHTEHRAVTYLKCVEFELTPGVSDDGKGGYLVVDGELVSRFGDEKKQEGNDGKKNDSKKLLGNHQSTESGITVKHGSPDSWRVRYGPTKMRVTKGGARVFIAGAGGSAGDAA